MPLHFRARAAHAQIFSGKIEAFAGVECDSKGLAVLVQAQFGRPGRRCSRSHRQSSVMWPSSMTFFHFTYSLLVKAAPSARLVPRGVSPNLAKAVLRSGFCNALPIAALSLASTDGGVPAVP